MTQILAFLCGIIIGAVAASLVAIRKAQAPRAVGKLSVQYRGPGDIAGTELDPDIVIHRTEGR